MRYVRRGMRCSEFSACTGSPIRIIISKNLQIPYIAFLNRTGRFEKKDADILRNSHKLGGNSKNIGIYL